MAQRSGFDGVFLDTDGTPLVNISASVLDGSNSPVTVYAAKSGSAEQAQPIITTSATPGLVRFWAEPGFYQVEISDNEIPARFASRKIPFDAVAGDTTLGDEGISLDQIPTITTAKLPEIPTEKIEDDAITAAKLKDSSSVDSDRAVTTNHIRNDAVTADKLTPVFQRDFVTTSYEISQNLWNDVLSLSLTAGTWVLIANINYSKPQSNVFYYKIWGDATGMTNNDIYVSEVINYGGSAFAFGWSNIWTISSSSTAKVQIYPTSGKQVAGKGSSFVAYRIG